MKIKSVMLLLLTIVSPLANAHVSWFVNPDSEFDTVAQFGMFDPVTLVIGAGFCFILCAAFVVHWWLGVQEYSNAFLHYKMIFALSDIVRIVFGVFLLVNSLDGHLFAPHIVPGVSHQGVILLQALAGVLLVSGKAVLLACSVLMGLFTYLFAIKGAVVLLEYFNLVGIVLFILLMRFTASVHWNERSNKAGSDAGNDEGIYVKFYSAVTVLRVTMGCALITLGLSEKIMNPGLAMELMTQYESLNFMGLLFEGFSHSIFILCNGAAEILFGVIYLIGIVPRLNTAALAGFLISSNIYFYFMNEVDLAVMELVGHGPLLATALIILVAGSSKTYRSTFACVLDTANSIFTIDKGFARFVSARGFVRNLSRGALSRVRAD
ncbi:MAG: hypothetical protein COB04_07785 [Gammaproteobacteria bacterium]|nr:MAG: hypothetical protein COB04_07785 [Gammaproteobacteria bacterium]